MRILIADDEPLARARLAALLRDCEGAEVVASVGDGEAALAACAQHRPELLLLDIAMPGLDGIGVARRLAALPDPPQLVFCTAYEEHALAAYELRAADYLLKPVRIERLREALARARALQRRAPFAAATLLAQVHGAPLKVHLDEVLYMTADDKYVTLHRAAGDLLSEQSLKAIEEMFPERFVRVHRACLIPVERLLGLHRDPDGTVRALIAGSAASPEVSRRNLPTVRRLLRGGQD
ncbi:MAG: LytTR family DNA-binding domain-containing protein [Xanthomonadaceae bacterium]|nr:LytTR family DNA-binding domain-containing protein [Xanthomonadaceae bacterium]MDE2054776.1 response regulator transcription factor [Xanthomonadaceae bacterium]